MPNYRRCYVPGGFYFFTVVTERRASILGTDLARDLLRAVFRDCFDRWPPFRVDALVMLRDHLHAIWTLPPGDADYSNRWGAIKKHFTQSWLARGGAEKPLTASRQCRRRRGVWQRGFWEHTLRDERDYARHLIISTTTRSNMSWWNAPAIGPIPRFIAGLNRAPMILTGVALPVESSTSPIWWKRSGNEPAAMVRGACLTRTASLAGNRATAAVGVDPINLGFATTQ